MPAFTVIDHAHMAQALRLAEQGLYTTQPNPRVGCVIAHGDEVVGSGWHARAGEPHAEVFALREADERARGATAYVTLEPCVHFGKTPPCADALIAAGVARVIAACEDSNPRVAGGGLAKLHTSGITVETGLMRDVARELNRGFFSRIERGRPSVRVKLAMSLDGRTALANGASQWITGEAARADVQRWRARSSAILTGSGTVRADDPHLTVRLEPLSHRERGWGDGPAESERYVASVPSPGPAASLLPMGEGKSFVPPLRVVLDRELCTLQNAHVLDGSVPTLVFHAFGATPAHGGFGHVECVAVELHADRLDLAYVLRILAERGVNELQVEAGTTLCGALFASGVVDELLLYISPILLGNLAQPLLKLPGIDEIAAGRRLRVMDQRQIGNDWRLLLRE